MNAAFLSNFFVCLCLYFFSFYVVLPSQRLTITGLINSRYVVTLLVCRNNPTPKTTRNMQEQKELAFSFTMIVCRHGCHYCFSASVIIGGSHQKENAFVFLGINGMNDLGK